MIIRSLIWGSHCAQKKTPDPFCPLYYKLTGHYFLLLKAHLDWGLDPSN